MTTFAWIGSYLIVTALLLAFNHGAHRKPTPKPDPLVKVGGDRLGEVWVRESEAWRWR